MASCKGCGTTTAISVLTFNIKDELGNKVKDEKGYFVTNERCNECSRLTLAPITPKDAMGNTVKWDGEARYSYSMGKVIKSASDVSDFCKANGYAQTPDIPDLPDQPA